MRTVAELGNALGLAPGEIHPAGASAGKVPVSVVRSRAGAGRRGKLVLVSAMTPTQHGEGKTVTTIGLSDALNRIGHHAIACLRQPSMGRSSASRGARRGVAARPSSRRPRSTSGSPGTFTRSARPTTCSRRCSTITSTTATGSASTRPVRVAPNPRRRGPGPPPDSDLGQARGTVATRSGRFLITAASEVMAILALSRDYADLKERLSMVLVGVTPSGAATRERPGGGRGDGRPPSRRARTERRAEPRGQSRDHSCGPFGNIAHGTASRLSIELALGSAEYTIVEAGSPPSSGRRSSWTS